MLTGQMVLASSVQLGVCAAAPCTALLAEQRLLPALCWQVACDLTSPTERGSSVERAKTGLPKPERTWRLTQQTVSTPWPRAALRRVLFPSTAYPHAHQLHGLLHWRGISHSWGASAAAEPAPALVTFPLAQTGEGISECELIQWHVKEGDVVKEFDKLCDVQSDKASVEITSRFNGVVRTLHHPPGTMVKVGAPLLDLEVAGGGTAGATLAPLPSPTPPIPALSTAPVHGLPQPSAPTPPSAQLRDDPLAHAMAAVAAADLQPGGVAAGVLAPPAVRRLARELGVELAAVRGTGPGGRVTKDDVLGHVQATAAARDLTAGAVHAAATSAAFSNGSSSGAAPAHLAAVAAAAAAGLDSPPAFLQPPAPGAAPTVLQVKGYRRAMIKSMTAVAAVPHFHLHDEARVDALLAVRKALGTDRDMHGTKLTMLPFIIKAVSLALQKHPLLNASLSPDGSAILLHATHNIGVAMATPHGLVVPNIKQVQALSVVDVAREVARLQAAAAIGKLSTEDITGGTLTISNIGSIGGLFANPLVNPPESAILAIGRVRQVAAPAGSHVGAAGCATGGVASVLGMSWGADHRVVDGAALAGASNDVKVYLEQPERMLLRLR